MLVPVTGLRRFFVSRLTRDRGRRCATSSLTFPPHTRRSQGRGRGPGTRSRGGHLTSRPPAPDIELHTVVSSQHSNSRLRSLTRCEQTAAPPPRCAPGSPDPTNDAPRSAHPRSNLSHLGRWSDALTLFLIPSRPAPRTPTRPLLPSDSLSDSDRSCRRRAASSRPHPFCCHARRRNASPQRPLLPRETLILLPDDQRLPLGLHGRPGAHRRRLIKVGGHETYE